MNRGNLGDMSNFPPHFWHRLLNREKPHMHGGNKQTNKPSNINLSSPCPGVGSGFQLISGLLRSLNIHAVSLHVHM